MGVNGLWTVVQPCARPTNLATLNRKRLAVDASIWIYQFLKAVRDKEGNALRNSHVVGFFRRICKLLWFGIQPVFVFDGGAPALKRATIQKRQRRREGRRDDAVRTAGKLLAVQMQRVAEEEEQKRRRENERPQAAREAEESLPDTNELVYFDEIGMSNQERQRSRKFHKKDAYHLPELEGGIASMGKPDDPRIMSVEELEEYARQFNNGEDINLYDFSKIDFDGEFFKSLPPPDRYNILNAARLRSRLRMGLSKDQLDDMFPDRMAFSRFQIERVQERNHLTQRLMYEVGMTGTDLTLGVNARVAGEKDREYILVKNEGAEGGWALGVVSKEKDIGEAHKPIDVDAIEIQYQTKAEEEEEDEMEDFEDVPIEGLNRLPKYDPTAASLEAARDIASKRQQFYESHKETSNGEEDSLFVGGPSETPAIETAEVDLTTLDEEDDLNRAIALSLQNQHGVRENSATEDDLFEDVSIGDKPEWTQKAVEAAKPLTAHGGSMIAHIVNNRSNAAVPKRQDKPATEDSDSDEDMQAIMARSRKAKKQAAPAPRPVLENKKNPFDGPLPFPKLSWGSSLFGKSKGSSAPAKESAHTTDTAEGEKRDEDDTDMAGGFTVEGQDDQAPELPPWLADESDIRESLRKQQDADREINAQDREDAEELERRRKKEMQDRLIEIESDSDNDSDIQIIEIPPSPSPGPGIQEPEAAESQTEPIHVEPEIQMEGSTQVQPTMTESQFSAVPELAEATQATTPLKDADSPEPEFEDIELPQATEEPAEVEPEATTDITVAQGQASTAPATIDDDELFGDADENEYSDPEEEELLMQMAEEAEEHARFATELNQKSMEQNRRDYEQELRQLRTQQKKDRRDADEVTQVMISECQSLLRLFGIPYITAPMEAEAQCAELVRLGMVDGIVTDDSDTFLFGGTRVYKNMFNSNKFVECYIGNELEKDLSLSRQQLISLAHLLGSDYTEGLPGVGPVTAVEIISEFPGQDGLSNFRAWWDAVQSQSRPKAEDASSPFRKKFRRSQATKLFLPPGFPNLAVDDAYLHPEVDSSTEAFQWGVPDLEGLRQFLMATIGWSKERTDEVLVPVIRDMNKREVEGTQSNITKFFGGGVGAGAREAFAPRQTATASKRMAAAVDRLRKNTSGETDGAAQESNKRQRRSRLSSSFQIGISYMPQTGNWALVRRPAKARAARFPPTPSMAFAAAIPNQGPKTTTPQRIPPFAPPTYPRVTESTNRGLLLPDFRLKKTTAMDQRELESRIKALTKSVAANEPADNALRLLDSLKKDAAPTEEMLRATRAGVFVGKLRSNPNKEIARAASELVNKWKKLVEQEKNSKLQKSKLGSPASGTASSPPAPLPASGGSSKKFSGDPETRKYDADGVDIKRTDSAVRNNCIGLIYNGLAYRSTASESDVLAKAVAVEAAAYKHFKGEGIDYKKKIRSLFTNLKNKSNRALGQSVMASEIPPDRFVAMTDDDLKSDDQRKQEIELEKENMKKAQVPMAEKSISDSLECSKCKKKKVSYTQAQTRSADEPMTTFCECMNCGNRWKFS
ncbi:hypothetical protein NLG97_g5086 [Lecanicillium saksenae]|uniref:Uncharacterized protein n=1 Tax=Lecanicillium saksenae TaxID=468837 RepID=A0ACC1QTF5_9HYPO|nr:hypothetical protein NLG97_g5086 [Lecanicillium saksenae]